MDENEKFNESLKDMGINVEQASGATQELVKILGTLNKASKEEQAASEAVAKINKKLQERAAKLESGWGGLLAAGVGLVATLNSATSSVYGSDKAFTSLIPTLDAFSSTTKAIITAFGELGSGASVAGFSLGKASEGAAKIVNVGVDIVSNAAKFQLETAQKVADSYVEASKAGAGFATGIESLARDAKSAGLPMQMYTKILTTNIEAIGNFGIGVSNGAMKLADMASDIGRTDHQLLAMYGGFEGLSKGIADYMDLQTQLGQNNKISSKEQISGATEYLRRQRELTDITGKNAEQLKKEEQERRTRLDYTLKLGRLGEVAQKNVQEGMAVAGKIFGTSGAKYAEEYFATGGKVISEEGLRYQAMNREAANTIGQMLDTADQSREGFRTSYSKVLSDNATLLEAAARANEDLATINRAANNDIIRGMAETSSSIIANLNLIKNAGSITAEIESKRQAEMDSATKGFATAIERLTESQMKIDASVVKNMSQMDKLVGFLYDQQQKIIDAQDKVINVINAITTGSFTDFKKALSELTLFMMGKMGDDLKKNQGQAAAPSAPVVSQAGQGQQVLLNQIDQNNAKLAADRAAYEERVRKAQEAKATDNKRADGGVAYGPTLTGEAGPEAHIPLKNNSIPMNIDFGPVIQAMNQQSRLTEELISQVRDSKDVQERILNASY